MSYATLTVGITSLCVTVIFIILQFPDILAIVLNMFPQGIFGVWLMMMCWRMKSILSPWLRWFGISTGFGLVLAGVLPVGYAIFVDPIILRIPAAPDEEAAKVPSDSIATTDLHLLLDIGTLIGILTLPIWTFLVGGNFAGKVD
ncbi:MAG: hypothetical protein ABIS36_17100 [Chryseolinea sp.]